MSFTIENIGALDRIKARFRKLENPDAIPLMTAWMDIIRKDNREGILAGTDKDGMPMFDLKYRPKASVQKYKIFQGGETWGWGFRLVHGIGTTKAQRLGQAAGKKKDLAFGGMGPHLSGWNNNLTSAEYRVLDGPPLAPRRQFSRVITNLLTAYSRMSGTQWEAFGYWDQVVDVEGRSFLWHHFRGGLHLPRRDLRGVRPLGMSLARKAARAWFVDMVRTHAT